VGQCDLDLPVGVGAEEFDIAHLDRPQPADLARDAPGRTGVKVRGFYQMPDFRA
jgi:hypothetical protein